MSSNWLERKPGTGVVVRFCSGRGCLAVILGLFLAAPPVVQACTVDADCDDGNPCTKDECLIGPTGPPGVCWNVSDCEDGLFCNGTELCCTTYPDCGGVPFGQCIPGTPLSCPPGKFCSEVLDQCVWCETHADCDDQNPCTDDTCDVVNGCQYSPSTGPCDDGNNCTVDDACRDVCEGGDHDGEICIDNRDCVGIVSGTCVGPVCAGLPKDCMAEAPECHTGWCSLITGDCSFTPMSDGVPCDDGDQCTWIDECQDGVCVGGPSDGCVSLELRAPGVQTISVGDIVEIEFHMTASGCASNDICGGTIQPVAAIEAVISWDPLVLELAPTGVCYGGDYDGLPCSTDAECPPAGVGECGVNPEDPCDDPDPCEYDCGSPIRYNWSESFFPSDCPPFGDDINAPCRRFCSGGVNHGLPCLIHDDCPPEDVGYCITLVGTAGNDGDAFYTANQQWVCDGERADPACVADLGIWVTTFKFRALAATLGISDGTPVAVENCIVQTRTKVASGAVPGEDVTGLLGEPALVQVACIDGSDCPYGICQEGVCLACPAPVAVTEGSRYIGVTPQPGPPEQAIWVTGEDPDVSCVYGYVRSATYRGKVEQCDNPPCEPDYLPPGPEGWDTVQVRGFELIGGKTYSIQTDCDPANPGTSLSEPVSATLWQWGDTDNWGGVDIRDVTRILDGFRGMFHTFYCEIDEDCMNPPVPPHFTCDTTVYKCLSATLENVDVYGATGCMPERVISILDVTVDLDAFRGFPDPCAVTRCQP